MGKCWAVLTILAATATNSWAATDPHAAPDLEAPAPVLAIVYMLVAAGGVCVVAFKDSKRTHLD